MNDLFLLFNPEYDQDLYNELETSENQEIDDILNEYDF